MTGFTVSSTTLKLKNKKKPITVTVDKIVRKGGESYIKLIEHPDDLISLNGQTGSSIGISKGSVVTLLAAGKNEFGVNLFILDFKDSKGGEASAPPAAATAEKDKGIKPKSPMSRTILSNDFM